MFAPVVANNPPGPSDVSPPVPPPTDQPPQPTTPNLSLMSGDATGVRPDTGNGNLSLTHGDTGLHPVMSAKTALDIAKNWDTGATRAIYHPGNPQQPPGYTIVNQKGGSSYVPIQAFVANNPHEVASENLGRTMMASAANAKAEADTAMPAKLANAGVAIAGAENANPPEAPGTPGGGAVADAGAQDTDRGQPVQAADQFTNRFNQPVPGQTPPPTEEPPNHNNGQVKTDKEKADWQARTNGQLTEEQALDLAYTLQHSGAIDGQPTGKNGYKVAQVLDNGAVMYFDPSKDNGHGQPSGSLFFEEPGADPYHTVRLYPGISQGWMDHMSNDDETAYRIHEATGLDRNSINNLSPDDKRLILMSNFRNKMFKPAGEVTGAEDAMRRVSMYANRVNDLVKSMPESDFSLPSEEINRLTQLFPSGSSNNPMDPRNLPIISGLLKSDQQNPERLQRWQQLNQADHQLRMAIYSDPTMDAQAKKEAIASMGDHAFQNRNYSGIINQFTTDANDRYKFKIRDDLDQRYDVGTLYRKDLANVVAHGRPLDRDWERPDTLDEQTLKKQPSPSPSPSPGVTAPGNAIPGGTVDKPVDWTGKKPDEIQSLVPKLQTGAVIGITDQNGKVWKRRKDANGNMVPVD